MAALQLRCLRNAPTHVLNCHLIVLQNCSALRSEVTKMMFCCIIFRCSMQLAEVLVAVIRNSLNVCCRSGDFP